MTERRYRKALVTGGAGFIGSHLSQALVRQGLDVYVLDNLSMGKAENVPAGAKLIVGDILDADALAGILSGGIDIVFHEAAIVSIRKSMQDYLQDARTNLLGTLSVLQAATSFGVKKLVYASSMAVYSDNPGRTATDERYSKEPISPYGLAKLTSEKYLEMAAQNSSLQIACLRYFNTYGPNQTLTPYVGVITIFVNRLLRGEPPIIFGDGEQTRDFVCVHDVVQANLRAMESDIGFSIYNVGTGIGTTVNQVADLLCKKIDPKIRPVHGDPVSGEPRFSIADIGKISKELGYKPRFQLETEIDTVIRQYS